jgi:hypothetical protein
MTTNLEQRKYYWKSEYPTLINWEIIGGPLDKETAQILETKTAQDRGCESHPGGDNPDDPFAQWWVYYFEY